MSFLGNLVWILFGGLILSAAYLLLGIIYCITIIGIPVGVQLFKMASLALWPFGREVKDREGSMGCWSLGLNILWIVFGGIEMAMSHVVIGLIFCITIVGIPFGLQHFKLALLALIPFGKVIK
ncbi:MAG: YccF domain-containing protein [Bacteroidaceae bacterium]|nr:YccF domain-containing protein [Bacteroidaceae bacterium]